ncbi:conserved hypothetical protein [Ricinus communis]|uniref:Uncharacterized protein n=1 Tax=Ricinus communis TaxID=3988 RepID=B9RXE6_RICCO|nr:conserved hypothetical protein [Ricinus communis]
MKRTKNDSRETVDTAVFIWMRARGGVGACKSREHRLLLSFVIMGPKAAAALALVALHCNRTGPE